MPKAHLVAHGDAIRNPRVRQRVLTAEEVLTDGGKRHAEYMGTLLLGNGVPARSVILSSSDSASRETARIIKGLLTGPGPKETELYGSDLLHEAGQFPRAVLSLRRLVDVALDVYGVHLNNRHLVMVTHRPLLEAVAGSSDLADNELVALPQLDEWKNPAFSPLQQWKFLPELGEFTP